MSSTRAGDTVIESDVKDSVFGRCTVTAPGDFATDFKIADH